jgi:hypothetical protein
MTIYIPEILESDPPPSKPKIYHITHIKNLQSIINAEKLLSEFRLENENILYQNIANNEIKNRRKTNILKSTNRHVYEYVPFYYCPRSPMLYTLRNNQSKIIHIEFDYNKTINFLQVNSIPFIITSNNAGSNRFNEYLKPDEIDKLNWSAINSQSWSDCKSQKQAEFLVYESVPIQLCTQIGVFDSYAYSVVKSISPAIQTTIIKGWYY